jgi:hypothetical protein
MNVRSIFGAFVFVIGSTTALAEAGQSCVQITVQTGEDCDVDADCDASGCTYGPPQCTPEYGPITVCTTTPDPSTGPAVEDRSGRGHF